MRALRTSVASVLLVVLASCSKQGEQTSASRGLEGFECNDRRVEYMVAGGFGAEEAGITMVCDGENPRVLKWRLEEGERTESTHTLSAQQFDEVWEKVDSTGWRHVDEDCNNSAAQPEDPVYVIDVADHSQSNSLNCQGKVLPFPYDRIVNELDLRAAGFGDQDGAAP